ncbi:MAG: DNA repair protein RecN [Actinomycetota bacterium]|nr:DNA repair protein RecN [Actinomycetota bacterium]
MLRELHIKNLILIDELYIEFDRGLNVLTGETGAGKTALIEAVNLLLGERSDTGMIRSGTDEAKVEGLFTIPPSRLLELEDLREYLGDSAEYVIVRKISKEGKSKCYINGNMVTLSTIKDLGNLLIDLHGQHDHQSLLKTANHLNFLDRYGGSDLLELKSKYQAKHLSLKRDTGLLNRLSDSKGEREKEKDLLKFQIDEIENAALTLGEEEALVQEAEVLSSSERIMEALLSTKDSISSDLDNSVMDSLKRSEVLLSKVADLEPRLFAAHQRLEGISVELEDLAGELRRLAEDFAYNPERLKEVQDRLAAISFLKKKYGQSVGEILYFLERAKQELSLIDDSGERIKDLFESVEASKVELYSLGVELSKRRLKAASLFEAEVITHLKDLNMVKIDFKVDIETLGREDLLQSSTGIDRIEFLISPNQGEALRPLAKIASGGEISRVMLALKIALAKVDEIETLIFDEIDSGVGAVTAGYVGEKLSLLSDTHQIICVTHLPQIAAYGELHYRVFKEEESGATKTHIDKLSFDDRIDEIARMLGGKGSPTELSKEHAKELLKLAIG